MRDANGKQYANSLAIRILVAVLPIEIRCKEKIEVFPSSFRIANCKSVIME